jgi:uncharacterized membrane protein
VSAIGFTKVSIALENAQLAIANALVLLAIIFVLFGQRYAPKKKECVPHRMSRSFYKMLLTPS